MSIPSQEGWQPQQPWGDAQSDQGEQPYGQPFDPTVSSPHQQPPPPGWEQGTWTQHAGPPTRAVGARFLLLIVVTVFLFIALAVGVTLL